MEQKKQIQLQFRLKDVRLLQFVNLSNGWPEGDMQIGNQIQFNADTAQRMVMCNMNVEYKKNDLTQLIFGAQCVIEFSRESWSALYQLQGSACRAGLPSGRCHSGCRTWHACPQERGGRPAPPHSASDGSPPDCARKPAFPPPEVCLGDALAPIGRQRLSLGLSLPAAAGMGAAAERWGRGAWCGSGFLQSGAARGFIGGWRGASRVWGMRGFGKSRLVLSGKCRIAAILPLPKVFGSGLPQSCRFPKSLAPDCCNPVVFSPELPGFREIQEKTCRKWPVL